MKIKTLKPKVVKVQREIDEIRIVTYFGSQSTDYAIQLWEGEEKVQEIDVKSLEDGIRKLQDLLS